MDLPRLTILGCEEGEWNTRHCAQRIYSDAGQPSAREPVGVSGYW